MTTFFIGGSMRSGTALLTSILCSDPSTNPAIGEVQYLTQLMRAHLWGQAHFGSFLKDTFDDPADFEAFTGAWLADYLERTRKRWQPCQHLVLKNPELLQFFPELARLVEEAKFFLVVRDPRDTVVSMRDVARKQREGGTDSSLTRLNDDARGLARFYLGYYARFLRGDFSALQSRLFLVRYEDLVSETDQVVEQIRGFTDLPLAEYDPGSEWQRTTRDYEALRGHQLHGPFTSALYGKAVSDSRIGLYREALSAAETAAVEQECQAIMRAFRYEPAAQQAS